MGSRDRDLGIDPDVARIIRYKASRLVGHAGFLFDDLEDLEQELMLDLLRRLPKWDAAQAQLKTFVSRIVDHKIATLITAQKAGIRNYRDRGHSLNAPLVPEDDESVERGEIIDLDDYLLRTGKASRPLAELDDLRIDVWRVIDRLPPRLRDLCERLRTQTVAEISRDTGIPRGTIYELVTKLRVIFEKAGLRDYL